MFLFYVGYRLFIPRSGVSIEDGKVKEIDDDEYTDYEEVDD